ncbi:MAG: histidine triad nucleotide-binding protein [Oscillospiraceae bacterium]|jgi:histidine triad (HIT) family protein|nr:histidine triad nucleotide-binding protein [Oscillospiraceae bacterium]
MNDCIFCKLASGEIPTNKVYEDELCLAFHDMQPLAPQHILLIPKQHIPSAAALTKENAAVVSHIFCVIAKLMEGKENGFRVVTNSGKDAGQTVQHLHFHVLSGQTLGSFH